MSDYENDDLSDVMEEDEDDMIDTGEEVNHVKEMGEDEAPLVKSCCEMLAKLYFFVSFANKSLLFRTKVACKLALGGRVAKVFSAKKRAPRPGCWLKQKG